MYLHHVSIEVNNYDACIHFYKAIGMTEYCSWIWPHDGSDYRKGDRNCFLALDGVPIIELHEVPVPNRPQGILAHLCLMFQTNEEMDRVFRKAVEAGGTGLAEPFVTDLLCEPKPIYGSRIAHVLGPAGEQIELLCWHGYCP